MNDKPLKIAVAQLNMTSCDVAGNCARIAAAWDEAAMQGAELVVTPEQSITGYPLEDTAKNPDLLAAAQQAKMLLAGKSKMMRTGLIAGLPERGPQGAIINTAYLFDGGYAKRIAVKRFLPNHDVFDEKRIYTAGSASQVFRFRGYWVGAMICEDTWHKDVAADLKKAGAELLISINASPFHAGKHKQRLDEVLRPRIAETGLPLLYVNQVGGQDELVFDGRSVALNKDGQVAAQMAGFEESLSMMTFKGGAFQPGEKHAIGAGLEESYRALVAGTRDYIRKGGFTDVVLGMSGGIDSALVAAIAVDALGPDHVHLYKLPSHFSSKGSRKDADRAAKMLGTPIEEIAIAPTYNKLLKSLKPHFNKKEFDVTEENLQARIRGTILMALSNKNGALLLSTGNKSEVSVGYCTLYGDMNGGFNPLKDVWKMTVYALSRWRNANRPEGLLGPDHPVIPKAIIDKAPSAELSPDQKDSDSLPPYPVLDEILKRYVEQDQAIVKIVRETGFDRGLVENIVTKVDRSEFKRQQSCPGVKITPCNFGKGRRVPITRPALPKTMGGIKKLILK